MSLQSEATAAMNLIFETFKRDSLVKFYKTAQQEILVSDPQWNSDFGNPYATNIVSTAQSQEFACRIWWVKGPSVEKSFDGDENIGTKLFYPIGSVRLQVKEDALEWLMDAKSFIIKGDKYVKDSDWRGIGMLGTIDRYEVVLKKDQ